MAPLVSPKRAFLAPCHLSRYTAFALLPDKHAQTRMLNFCNPFMCLSLLSWALLSATSLAVFFVMGAAPLPRARAEVGTYRPRGRRGAGAASRWSAGPWWDLPAQARALRRRVEPWSEEQAKWWRRQGDWWAAQVKRQADLEEQAKWWRRQGDWWTAQVLG